MLRGVKTAFRKNKRKRKEKRKEENLGKKRKKYLRNYYLGSLGDLLARLILGDFFAAQSSLSSISLESEQLQLSITVEIKLFPQISSIKTSPRKCKCYFRKLVSITTISHQKHKSNPQAAVEIKLCRDNQSFFTLPSINSKFPIVQTQVNMIQRGEQHSIDFKIETKECFVLISNLFPTIQHTRSSLL